MNKRTWRIAAAEIAWLKVMTWPRTGFRKYAIDIEKFLKGDFECVFSETEKHNTAMCIGAKQDPNEFYLDFICWLEKHNTTETEECPACGGDGKETCDNPDHGFISSLASWHDKGRLGCPCCGHDPNHKVINGGKCETCDGSGTVTKSFADKWFKENEVKR